MIGWIRKSFRLRGIVFFVGAFMAPVSIAAGQSGATPSAAPTFTRDILPLLETHCQTCHRPGEIAPMSLVTYEEVRPWAKAILKEVSAGRMPPFHAAGTAGRFKDDLRLGQDQIAHIEQWVRSGASRGPEDAGHIPKVWPDSEWRGGEPDLVIDFDEIQVTGTDADQFIVVEDDYVFAEDTWIQGIEYRPSNRARVHHAGLFALHERTADTPPAADVPFLAPAVNELIQRGSLMLTWLPGREPFAYPDGQGFMIAKGMHIALQVHVGPTPDSFTERSSVGIRFVDDILRYTTENIAHFFPHLKIPPGESNYECRGRQTIQQDLAVQSFNIHMHLRGKSSTVLFHYPDGRTEEAFHIPQFSFDWQRQYYLAEPMDIPKGTVVESIAVWDNSDDNPLNPDSSQTVTWGQRTTDEMYGSVVQCRALRETPITVEHGRAIGDGSTGEGLEGR